MIKRLTVNQNYKRTGGGFLHHCSNLSTVVPNIYLNDFNNSVAVMPCSELKALVILFAPSKPTSYAITDTFLPVHGRSSLRAFCSLISYKIWCWLPF